MLRANEPEPAEEDRLIRTRATRPWKPRTALVALAALAVAMATAPAALSVRSPLAAVDPDAAEFAAIRELLLLLSVDDEQLAQIAAATQLDGTADHFHSTGQPAGVRSPRTDLIAGAVFELVLDPSERASLFDDGVLACEEEGVACPVQAAGNPPGTEYYVYVGSTSGPLAPTAGFDLQAGLSAFDMTPIGDGEPRAWAALSSFPLDYWDGMNAAWQVESSNGGPFRMRLFTYGEGDEGFVDTPTDARSVVRGSAIMTLIPADEWDGVINGRVFTFENRAGTFLPADSGADAYPDMGTPPLMYGLIPAISYGAAAPSSPSPAGTTAAPAAGPSETAVASASPTPGGTPTGSGGGGPNALWLVLIGLGGLLVILGGWLLFGRRGVARDDGAIAALDPCADLLAARDKARADCEEARRAVTEARAEQKRRAAEERAARERLRDATRAREEVERDREQAARAPDRGKDSVENEERRIDEHDRALRERAYAEAREAYDAARAAAADDAGRTQAGLDYEQRLRDIADPDGIDKLRDAHADAGLAAARAAEANAQAGVESAAKATEAAAAAAAAAGARANEICARVDGAEAAHRTCVEGREHTRDGHGLQLDDGGGKVEIETTGGQGVTLDGTGTKVTAPRVAPDATVGSGATQPRVCRDGAEEWRNEGKRQKFTVPVPGAKIQVTSEPSQTNLDAWLDDWRAVDADVHPLPAPTDDRGIPPTIFVRQAADRIRHLWEGLDGPVRQVVEVTIVLPLQRVEIQCQRLYRCENGAWARTTQKRLVEYDPVPSPKSHVLEGQVHTSSDVFALWEKASRDWQKDVPNDEALERARIRCQHGD